MEQESCAEVQFTRVKPFRLALPSHYTCKVPHAKRRTVGAEGVEAVAPCRGARAWTDGGSSLRQAVAFRLAASPDDPERDRRLAVSSAQRDQTKGRQPREQRSTSVRRVRGRSGHLRRVAHARVGARRCPRLRRRCRAPRVRGARDVGHPRLGVPRAAARCAPRRRAQAGPPPVSCSSRSSASPSSSARRGPIDADAEVPRVAEITVDALCHEPVIWRVRDEEALLRREFGRAWEGYAERSWRLVPFVF